MGSIRLSPKMYVRSKHLPTGPLLLLEGGLYRAFRGKEGKEGKEEKKGKEYKNGTRKGTK